jgi:hypothetical protein
MGEWMYRSAFYSHRHYLEVSGELHATATLPQGKSPRTHWLGWVDSRAGLDSVEKRKFLTLPGLVIRPLGRPARVQSLYRLRYPGSTFTLVQVYKNKNMFVLKAF